MSRAWSKLNLQGHLSNPRARAKTDNSAELPGRDITDRVVSIGVIQNIKEVRAELYVLLLPNREAPRDRKIYIYLRRPSQNIASHVANISRSLSARVNYRGGIMRTWNHLSRLYQGWRERRRIEVEPGWHIAHGAPCILSSNP